LECALGLRASLLNGLESVIEILLVVIIVFDLLLKCILLMGVVGLSGDTSERTLLPLAGILPIDITISAKVLIIFIVLFL
jgi:hypothetical protein